MYRQLLKDASYYSVGPLLARVLSLVTVPVFTHILSPTNYGALDILGASAVLAALFVGAALDQALGRFYLEASEETERKRIASTVLIYYVSAFTLFAAAALPFSEDAARLWMRGEVDYKTVAAALIFVWANGIFYIASNQLKYLFLSKAFAVCAIGNSVVSTLLSLLFVVYFRMSVFGIFIGQAVGVVIFALLAVYFARNAYRLTFNCRLLKTLLTYSLPLIPGTMALYLMQYLDRFAIQDLVNLRAVGIYGIGVRLASVINLFLAGFHSAWSPIVFRSFHEPNAPEKFRVVFNYYLFIVLVVMMTVSLFSREALLLLTTKTFSRGFVVVPLLMLSAILISIGQHFTYGIPIAKKSHYRMVLNLIAVTMNAVLNYTLIPLFGIVGAALATTLSAAFFAAAGMIVSQRLYPVPYQWRMLASALVLAVVVANAVTVPGVPIGWAASAVKVGVMTIGIAFLARILHILKGRGLIGWMTSGSVDA